MNKISLEKMFFKIAKIKFSDKIFDYYTESGWCLFDNKFITINDILKNRSNI